jgi:hypothetical protein
LHHPHAPSMLVPAIVISGFCAVAFAVSRNTFWLLVVAIAIAIVVAQLARVLFLSHSETTTSPTSIAIPNHPKPNGASATLNNQTQEKNAGNSVSVYSLWQSSDGRRIDCNTRPVAHNFALQ